MIQSTRVDLGPGDWRPNPGNDGSRRLQINVTGVRWTDQPGWVEIAHWCEHVEAETAQRRWHTVRLSALPEEVQAMLPYRPNPPPQHLAEIRVELVTHLGPDGKKVQHLDLLDRRSWVTLLSVSPEEASLLADEIREVADWAGNAPSQDSGRPIPGRPALSGP